MIGGEEEGKEPHFVLSQLSDGILTRQEVDMEHSRAPSPGRQRGGRERGKGRRYSKREGETL